jgi:hypothetical protein
MVANCRWSDPRTPRPDRLTPEEDALPDPDEEESDIDDLIPADLWF